MVDQRPEPHGCCMPPELGDLALIAAVDGEGDAETIAHIQICQYCASRAHEFAELQGLLRKQLYRMFCPTSDELAAFHQGMLNNKLRTQINTHVSGCPHCTGEMRLLTEALGMPPEPRPPPTDPLRIVAKLIPPSPLSQLAAISGGLRGVPSAGQYAYQAQNLQLMLDIKHTIHRPDRLALLGLLIVNDDLPDPLHSATADLLSGETVIGKTRLDELGYFTLDNLAPGNYTLALRLLDREIVVESLIL